MSGKQNKISPDFFENGKASTFVGLSFFRYVRLIRRIIGRDTYPTDKSKPRPKTFVLNRVIVWVESFLTTARRAHNLLDKAQALLLCVLLASRYAADR